MAPNSFSWFDREGSSHEHEDGTPHSFRGDLVCVYKNAGYKTVCDATALLTASDAFRKTGTSSCSDITCIHI